MSGQCALRAGSPRACAARRCGRTDAACGRCRRRDKRLQKARRGSRITHAGGAVCREAGRRACSDRLESAPALADRHLRVRIRASTAESTWRDDGDDSGWPLCRGPPPGPGPITSAEASTARRRRTARLSGLRPLLEPQNRHARARASDQRACAVEMITRQVRQQSAVAHEQMRRLLRASSGHWLSGFRRGVSTPDNDPFQESRIRVTATLPWPFVPPKARWRLSVRALQETRPGVPVPELQPDGGRNRLQRVPRPVSSAAML